jgi:hypothetical protein
MKTIPLTQGKVAIVDDEDFERVNQFKWYVHDVDNLFYAYRRQGRKSSLKMHRFILGLDDPKIHIDHKNHNGLDNQKKNLRVCNRNQNQHNRRKQKGSSRFKGVTWYKPLKKWRAQICVNNKQMHIGVFLSEQDAAIAYNQAATKYFGEFAHVTPISSPLAHPRW